MGLKKKFLTKLIPAVEIMLVKEKRHKAKLESLQSIHGSIKRAYIEQSEQMISHYENRLSEYKKYAESLED